MSFLLSYLIRLFQNHFDEIVFDNGLNVRMAAEKLIESNCKRILAVFGDENLKITQTRRDFFLEKLKEHPEIKCRVIYCKSAEDVKYQLNTILNDEHFDGYFAMSDETLAGLHSSLIKSKLQTSAIKVIAITEGILPSTLMILMNVSLMMVIIWEQWQHQKFWK